MKILLWSDIHAEIHETRALKLINDETFKDIDVVVLAGDIIGPRQDGRLWDEIVGRITDRAKRVVMVLGNHEHWSKSYEYVRIKAFNFAAKTPNFDLLGGHRIEIDGVGFIGNTLWFPDTVVARRLAPKWSDFSCIKDFEDWCWNVHRLHVKAIENHVQPGDVVITHYVPSFKSVTERYVNDPFNCFFVSDQEQLMEKNRIQAWLHGHTHSSFDYHVGETRVVCNPWGHPEENPQFDPRKIVEVYPNMDWLNIKWLRTHNTEPDNVR